MRGMLGIGHPDTFFRSKTEVQAFPRLFKAHKNEIVLCGGEHKGKATYKSTSSFGFTQKLLRCGDHALHAPARLSSSSAHIETVQSYL